MNLLCEVESDSSKAQVVYIYEGRLIPVSNAATAAHQVTVSTTATVDLLTKAPGGSLAALGANFLRLYVGSSGGNLSFWDNGLDPGTVTGAPTVAAGNYFDFPNVNEMSNLYVRAVTSSATISLLWYKTK